MLHFELLPTIALTGRSLDAVIALKSQHWPYPYQSQLRWFAEHAERGDRHLLGWVEQVLVAYLRIVGASGEQGGTHLALAFIDTVCVETSQMHRGLGIELMASANRTIGDSDEIGLLGCDGPLVDFYRRCGWSVFTGPLVIATSNLARIVRQRQTVMAYDARGQLGQSQLTVSESDKG